MSRVPRLESDSNSRFARRNEAPDQILNGDDPAQIFFFDPAQQPDQRRAARNRWTIR